MVSESGSSRSPSFCILALRYFQMFRVSTPSL